MLGGGPTTPVTRYDDWLVLGRQGGRAWKTTDGKRRRLRQQPQSGFSLNGLYRCCAREAQGRKNRPIGEGGSGGALRKGAGLNARFTSRRAGAAWGWSRSRTMHDPMHRAILHTEVWARVNRSCPPPPQARGACARQLAPIALRPLSPLAWNKLSATCHTPLQAEPRA